MAARVTGSGHVRMSESSFPKELHLYAHNALQRSQAHELPTLAVLGNSEGIKRGPGAYHRLPASVIGTGPSASEGVEGQEGLRLPPFMAEPTIAGFLLHHYKAHQARDFAGPAQRR